MSGFPENDEIPFGMIVPAFLGAATAGLFGAMVHDTVLGPEVTVLDTVGEYRLELRESWLSKNGYAVLQDTQDGPALIKMTYTNDREVANAAEEDFRQRYSAPAAL